MHTVAIKQQYADSVINLALDTLDRGKQALIFCNTKRGAESQAEKIAQKVRIENRNEQHRLETLAERILAAVSSPTKQCRRLALCVRKGIAFHHAGLHAKQREIVETAFRETVVKIICATPTLAMGIDMPAFRSIVRDYKRFSAGTSWGMSDIPVLEYEQMSGRAGRPGMEDTGEAILVAKTESERDHLIEKYIRGMPEEIYSKLAVEPVLRTYVLSLVASGYVHDHESLYEFFGKTFYAFQYGDEEKLRAILDKMVGLLATWEFVVAAGVRQDEFVPADAVQHGSIEATRLGRRVAELYLDPYTAHSLLEALGKKRLLTPFGLLHLLCSCLEMRPLSRVRPKDDMDDLLVRWEDDLLVMPPTAYSHEYEEFLQEVKTAAVLHSWIEEEGEDAILEKHGVTPGELQAKRSIGDWLCYSMAELAKLQGWRDMVKDIVRLRTRLQHGVKEELLPLLRLKGIGRVRGRKLHSRGIRTIADAKKAPVDKLRDILGARTAESVKEQLGQNVESVRKGQADLNAY